MGVGIELNLASNIKLGNIDGVEDERAKAAIQLYNSNGVPIFLGTDGYGLYQSTPEEQFDLAEKLGVNLEQILISEDKYLQKNKDLRMKTEPLPNDEASLAKRRIEEALKSMGIMVLQSQDAKPLAGKIPIVVAGGSFKTRSDGDLKDYKKIAIIMQLLANFINPKTCYLVTGGTDCGPEHILHQAIKNRNGKSTSQIQCVGIIPSYIGRLDEINAIQDSSKLSKGMTGAIVDKNAYKGWNDFATLLIRMSNNNYKVNPKGPKREKGFCIFIGGGETVKTEIILASQGLSANGKQEIEPVQSFCYKGFGKDSASQRALNKSNDNISGFSEAEELIREIYDYDRKIFIDSFDINELPQYIERIEKKGIINYKFFYDTLIDEGKYTEEQMDYVMKQIESTIKSGDEDKIEGIKKIIKYSKDLELFIKAYRTYYEERRASEMPAQFIKGVRFGEMSKAGEVIEEGIEKTENSEYNRTAQEEDKEKNGNR